MQRATKSPSNTATFTALSAIFFFFFNFDHQREKEICQLQGHKVVGVTFFVTTVLTIVLPIIFIVVATNGNGGTIICDRTIGCAGIEAALLLSIFMPLFG